MGVYIKGVDIPIRNRKPKNGYKTFCISGFERGLLKRERTYLDYDKDNQTKNSIGISYSSYNELRDYIALAFLNTTCEQIWERCSKLSKHQKYGRNLYFLINFADNEGFIGPQAVKKIAKYFTKKRIVKLQKMPKEYRQLCLLLIDTIKETSKMNNGYLVFS